MNLAVIMGILYRAGAHSYGGEWLPPFGDRELYGEAFMEDAVRGVVYLNSSRIFDLSIVFYHSPLALFLLYEVFDTCVRSRGPC
jgi:hypothetical protein